jgi:D-tyrosyl-tRNA(Tyr) deacylase
MDRSIREAGGDILLIPQFTLAADVEKGRRPSFDKAAPPAEAERLFGVFAQKIGEQGVRCVCGIFQAHMQVALTNDGPVTILLGKD